MKPNSIQSTLMRNALAVACCAAAPLSQAESETMKLHSTWTGSVTGSDTFPWLNEKEETVAWVNDGTVDAELRGVPGWNYGLKYGFVMNSLRLNYSGKEGGWFDQEGSFTIGAGGVQFENGPYMSCGKWFVSTSIMLSADQTWSVTDGKASRFAIGTDNYVETTRQYTYNQISALDGVGNWKLTGPLSFWAASSNDLSAVSVRYENGAKLFLEKSFVRSGVTYVCTPGLGAKSIAFKGDGIRYWAGGAAPENSPGAAKGYVNTVKLEPVMSPVTLGEKLILEDGADVSCRDAILSIGQIGVIGGDSTFEGPVTFDADALSLEIGASSSLSMEGLVVAEGVTPVVSVIGPGKLVVPATLNGTVSFTDSPELKIVGSGRWNHALAGVASLETSVTDGAYLYIPASAFNGVSGLSVMVTSGTLVLDDVPAGVTVTEAGGHYVTGGSGLIITEVERTESTLTVPVGQKLNVFGSGLTKNTSVTFQGSGTNLVFWGSATVGASLSFADDAGTSYVEVANESTVATISGAVSVGNGSNLYPTGPGWLIFAGGATFAGDAGLEVMDRCHVKFTNGDYVFNDGPCGVGFAETVIGNKRIGTFGRYLGIMDGGHFTTSCTGEARLNKAGLHAYTMTDSNGYGANLSGEAVVEIGVGGTVEIKKGHVAVGRNQSRGYLRLTGGTMKLANSAIFYLGAGGYATAIVEIESGTLEIPCGFTETQPLNGCNHGIVTWKGGTIRPGANAINGPMLRQNGDLSTLMHIDVQIAGDECVLDLTDLPYDSYVNRSISNSEGEIARGEWWGNGTLTVKGGKNFVMNAFPSGISLKLEGQGTTVTVPEDAKVYDYETCKLYCGWRNPYSTRAETHPEEVVVDASIGRLVIVDDVSFVNVGTERMISISEALVQSGGVWDTATTFVSDAQSVTNISFAVGSVLRPNIANGACEALTVVGSVTLPDGAMKYTVSSDGSRADDITIVTADSIIGSPDWVAVSPTRGYAAPQIAEGGKSITMSKLGLVLMVR